MSVARGAACALFVLAAACGTATSQESQEQVYDRPGIPNYQQAKAQTLGHRVAVFYDRVYWSGADALAGAQFASSVDALAAEIEAQVRSVAEAVAPRTPRYVGGGAGGGWAALRDCEAGGNYATDTGNGFYGAYQFDQQTWESVGGSGNPAHASPAEQDARAQALYTQRGSSPWPNCGRHL